MSNSSVVGDNFGSLLGLVLSWLLVLAAFAAAYAEISGRLKIIRSVKANGRHVWAELKEVQPEGLYYFIVATWTDDQGLVRAFKSNRIDYNPSAKIAPGQKIEVIIDPTNPDVYVMNTDFLKQR